MMLTAKDSDLGRRAPLNQGNFSNIPTLRALASAGAAPVSSFEAASCAIVPMTH